MKVLIIAPFYPSDSMPYAGSYIKNQIILLKKIHNVDFEVLTFKTRVPFGLDLLVSKYKTYKSIPDFIKHDGINVHFLSRFAPPRNIGMSLTSEYMYRIIKKFIKKNNITFDLIHSHFLYPTGEAAKRLAVETKKPLIITVHGTDVNKYMTWNTYTEKKCKRTLQYADQVVAVSKDLESKVKRVEPNVKTQIIYNFVNEDFYSGELKKSLSNKKNIEITFIGNLLIEKGVYELIDAYYKVITNNKKFKIHLNIVGVGPERLALKERLKELSIEDNVHFFGAVENKEIPNILRKTDIFILPSYSEGFPLTIIEALSMGCPVIATSVGGIPEVVRNEENGLLIESKNSTMIQDAIEKLINNPNLYNKIQKNASKVYEQFSGEKVTQQIYNVYTEAIKRK